MKNIDVDSEVANIMLNEDYKVKFHKILELMEPVAVTLTELMKCRV